MKSSRPRSAPDQFYLQTQPFSTFQENLVLMLCKIETFFIYFDSSLNESRKKHMIDSLPSPWFLINCLWAWTDASEALSSQASELVLGIEAKASEFLKYAITKGKNQYGSVGSWDKRFFLSSKKKWNFLCLINMVLSILSLERYTEDERWVAFIPWVHF